MYVSPTLPVNSSPLTCLQYYSRALSSPFGLKVKAFYTTTSKQVLDIHEEARRIASENPNAQHGAPHDTGISTGVGTAAPPVSSEVRTTAGPIISGDGIESQSGSIKTGEAPLVL